MDDLRTFHDQPYRLFFLDMPDLLKIELRGDNVQTFDTKWDETIIAMLKQPDEELLYKLYVRAHREI